MVFNQKGFSIAELAIALVVISLAIWGVIKGQSFIENTKINNLIKDFNRYENAVYSYTVNHRRAPGYIEVARRWEEDLLWKNLREERLIDGDPSDGSAPLHFMGDNANDAWDIQSDLSTSNSANVNFVLCARRLKPKYAEIIDLKMDNDDTSWGSGEFYLWHGNLCKKLIVGRRG